MSKKRLKSKQSSEAQNSSLKLTNDLQETLQLLETDLEIKSYIYQQINELAPYVTPETTVIVLARDPQEHREEEELEFHNESSEKFAFRIAIILKEQEATLEAEGYGHDVYDAIHFAKEALLMRLSELQEEVENPQDRLNAIQQASENGHLH